MRKDIHPNYKPIEITCSCGHRFETSSTLEKDELHIDICANCHPFYTGKQKIVDTAGRVDRFKQKYTTQTPREKPAIVATSASKKTVAKTFTKKPATSKTKLIKAKTE